MTNLSCVVDSCSYNKNEYCCLKSIQVGGEKADAPTNTCCSSFEENSGAFTNDAQQPEMNLDIKCDAGKCVYNSSGLCEAEHVDIAGISACDSEETLCATFHSEG